MKLTFYIENLSFHPIKYSQVRNCVILMPRATTKSVPWSQSGRLPGHLLGLPYITHRPRTCHLTLGEATSSKSVMVIGKEGLCFQAVL